MRGRVERGNGRGHQLGFPTANILAPASAISMREGVYAAWVKVGRGHTWFGATVSIGDNPTFNDVDRIQVEAYLHDFGDDLYDQEVELVIVARIRDMRRFRTANALSAEMARDVMISRRLLARAKSPAEIGGRSYTPDLGTEIAVQQEKTQGGGRSRWFALAFLTLAQFLIVLDASIVNVAVPAIGKDLLLSSQALTWIVSSYVIPFGGLLMLGGRLGDRYGHRPLFLMGVIVFLLASALAALAPSFEILLAARAAQGMSAAFLAPAALALLMRLFPANDGRGKAIGVWGGVAGLGGATGALMGGLLTTAFGWSAIFFVNIPMCLLVIAGTLRFVSANGQSLQRNPLDAMGAITVTLGMLAVVGAFSHALETGTFDVVALALAGGGVVLVALFIMIERRSHYPLIRLDIFTNPGVAFGNLSMFLVGGVTLSIFFFLSLHMQLVMGYSAAGTGLRQLPLAITFLTTAALLPSVIGRFGLRLVLTVSFLTLAAGLLALSQTQSGAGFLVALLIPTLIVGIGLGGTFIASTELAIENVEEADSGLASGLVNTSQQVGGAILLAFFATLPALLATQAPESASQESSLLHVEYTSAYLGIGIVCLIGAVVSFLSPQKRQPS
ncbi:MFS transporter [Devosia pacifica]|uniref:MFS transporter n=1 Tax=Devosia pacifica TaxID=1335967 RepID=UPI001675AB98|nr:MFS transporter [Devosia pacifica]